MKANIFNLIKLEADEGMVFDWVNLDEHQVEDEDGNMIQEHLYSKVIFLGAGDDSSNYVEVPAPVIE